MPGTTRNVYSGKWPEQPFTDSKSNILTQGIGLTTYSGGGGTAFASYKIKDMGFRTFSAQLCLDSNFVFGDYGKSAIGCLSPPEICRKNRR